MKIRKIKYKNHPILGNLELNLVNRKTGLPYDTIVFAGENGSGKTSVLSSLSTFLNRRSIEPFESIEYEANGKLFNVQPLDNGLHANIGYHKRINITDGNSINVMVAANNNEEQINRDLDDIRHYGCVFSKARANYSNRPIKGSTAIELDKSSYDDDNNEDFTPLKQLIIDVEIQDNRELKSAVKTAPPRSFDYQPFETSSRMYRFQQAFDTFFEKIEYSGVDPINGNLEVFFEKHNRKVSIDQLSTGEKQIVYRGIYLLRNVGRLDGAAIMIDEPELSMHHKWQKRILHYFKDLFKNADGSQKAQLFFATHSEYVLGEALKDTAKTLVVVLKDNNGTIEKKEVTAPLLLQTLVASEVNYVAFDVCTVDYHIALYGAIQSKYNKHSIASCDQFIETQCAPYFMAEHRCVTTYGGNTYNTLPTKIRNHIDHPDNPYTFTEEELKTSIILMRNILDNI